MNGPRATQRMRLSDTSLRVWRAVAARGRSGIGSAQVYDHFEGQLDTLPIRYALESLRKGGYLRNNDNGKHSTWWATERVPLGEDRPLWLDEAETEPDAALAADEKADDVIAAAKAIARTPGGGWPFGPLPTVEAIAATPVRSGDMVRPVTMPLFALDSMGCQSLRADGIDARLSAEATRALFAWLDRLSGMPAFADLVGAAP